MTRKPAGQTLAQSTTRNRLRSSVIAGSAISIYALCSMTAQAGSYRTELELAGLLSDQDLRIKENIYSAMATVYLQPVQTVNTIFAESAFLNKASSATLGYMDREIEQGNVTTDGDATALSGRYVSGEKYILEAHYSDGDFNKIDSKSYGFGIGHYIDDLTTLVLNYSRVDVDGTSDKLDNYLLTLKSIVDPTETDRAVGTVAMGISQNTVANTIINLEAGLDYYLGPRFSVGGNIGMVFPNNGNDENTYGLNSRYFFSERISVGASYQHTIFQEEEGTASVDASDTFTLSLTGRI